MKRQITTQKNAHNTSDRSVMRKNLGFSEHSAGDTGLHELTYLGCVLSSGGKGRSDAERPVHNPDRDIAKLTAVTDGSS